MEVLTFSGYGVAMSDQAPAQASTGETVLRVNGGTDSKKLAAAIVGVYTNDKKTPVLEYIGPGPGQQAVKAAIIANSYLATRGLRLVLEPLFVERCMPDNPHVTAIQLKVKVSPI